MRLFLFVLLLLNTEYLVSQCTNSTQWPVGTISASNYNDTVVISMTNSAGDYAILDNLVDGNTYQIASSIPGDYLTIRNAYDFGVLIAHGATPLVFTAGPDDIISLHINLLSPPCGTENIDRTTSVLCSSCSGLPPTVGVHESDPVASLEVNGEIKLGDSGRPPVEGMIRWNDTTNDFEGYNGTKWLSLTQSSMEGQWGTIPTNQQNPDQQLIASDGATTDQFGTSVSIAGDYAIIGAFRDSINTNSTQGSAYIFQRSGSSWTQQAKLTASDGAAGDQFGFSVSIAEDYAIIGASLDDMNTNTNQGAAYIFQRSGSSWTQQAKLTASDGAANDLFGTSVSIAGDYAIVGANGDNINSNTEQGSAYIFQRSGSSWTQQAKLTASDGAVGDNFGHSVSIAGDYAIVGAYGDEINSNDNQGSAYIFQRSGSSWTEQAKLTASDGAVLARFGVSVSIAGDYAIVGAYLDYINTNAAQGSAYIFKRSGSSWTQQAKLTASDGAAFARFGRSVSIAGDYAIVGAYFDDINSNSDQGSAYIFQRSGSSWTQQAKLTASDGAAGDRFGLSVSIAGDYAIVGAYFDDINSNSDQGSAHIIRKK